MPPIIANADAPSASVMLVPPPPKSSTATTPDRSKPGLALSAVSAATASGTSRGTAPVAAVNRLPAKADASAAVAEGFQYDGVAIATPDGGVGIAAAAASSRTATSSCSAG
ncbi:hypothetical protein [Mycolicibacterium sp. SCSIO 43805]|uniref:hypothetical protein n=1 Tax=Mycolicibacterium sp. SCSIO 43805 TaxID=3378074 RepID=UPI003AB3270B